MMKIISFNFLLFFILINQSCSPVLSQKTYLDSPENIRIFQMFRTGINKIFGPTSTSGRQLQENRQLRKIQEKILENASFPCDVKGWRSDVTPSNVNRLKPGDIDIIASMGDSLSAGAGIFGTFLLHIFIDNRGVTAAGGGQGTWKEYTTLPNMLKEFNPNLYGYSTGDYQITEKGSRFNVAQSGGISLDMPYMANILVKRLKSDPRVNMQKHWKHISLMIGSNDFCLFICTTSPDEFLQNHERDIIETLRILRNNIPRVFVSLIPPVNLKLLVESRTNGKPSLRCDLTTDFECPCLFGLAYRHKRQEYYNIMKRWQEVEVEISKYPEFQKDDFTVIIQPVLMGAEFPYRDGYSDSSLLTTDCFHVSQKTNANYGQSLWNSLISRIEEKPKNFFNVSSEFRCPTKNNPYLITYVNNDLREISE